MQRTVSNRSNPIAWVIPLGTILLLGIAATGGCVSGRGADFQSQAMKNIAFGDELPIQGELVQPYSNIAKPLRIVIYDYPSLTQFPLLALDVDFDTQMVLLAAMGPASSEHCRIQIERVWKDADRLQVEITETYPESDNQRKPTISSPIHAVVVPRCEWPIEGFTSRIPRNIHLP